MGKEQELLEACQSGRVDIVEKLISSKQKRFRRSALIACRDASGYTPLHYAALNGHRQIVSYLLAAEADLLAKDKKGCIPLHLAAFAGQKEIVQMLLAHDVSRQSVNAQNFAKEIPLHFAAQFNHCSVLNILLQYGADPSLRNSFGDNSLDLACRYGRLDAVRLLVSIRPQLVTASTGLDANGAHPPVSSLHLAAAKGNVEVVRLLLNAGFDANYVTSDGTALHMAAFFRRLDVAKLLIANGVDTTVRNSNGKTALDLLYEHQANKTHEITNLIQSSAAWETIIDILEDRMDQKEVQPVIVSPTNTVFQNMSPTPQRAVWTQYPDNSYQRTTNETQTTTRDAAGDETSAANVRKVPEQLNLFDTPIGSRLSAHHLYSADHSPISVKTIQSRSSDENSSLPCCCTVKEGYPSGANGSPPKPPRIMKYDLKGDELLQKNFEETAAEEDSSPESTGENFEPDFDDRPKSDSSDVQLRNDGTQGNAISTDFNEKFGAGTKSGAFDAENKFGADSSDVGINRVTYVVKNSDEAEPQEASFGASFAGDPGSRTSQLLQEGRLEESPVADDAEVRRRTAPIAKPESIYLDDSLAELTNVRSGLSPQLNMRLPTPEFSPPSAWASESKIFDQMIGPLEKNKSQSATLQQVEGQADPASKNDARSRDADTNTDDRYYSECSQYSRCSSHTESTECSCGGEYELVPLPSSQTISEREESTLKDDASPQPDLSSHDLISFVDDSGKDQSPPLDEQAEWDKVKSIVDSYLPGISSSQFSTLSTTGTSTLDEDPVADLSDKIGLWLSERGLGHMYWPLKNAGVSEFRDLALLEFSDLEALYLDAIDIDLFLEAQTSLELPNEEAKAGRHRFVSDWLLALDLSDYLGSFMKQGFDTMHKVQQISNAAQLKRLGVASLGHRKRIWWSLKAELNASTLEHRISVLKTGRAAHGSALEPGPEPPSSSSAALQQRGYSWKHRKESLLNGTISYSAHYLGSSLVDNLHGIESSKAAIAMRKKVSREIAKIPQVTLQVSHRGVRFLDIVTQRLISEHEIQDIHCVCQDERDMNCFAYITKQGEEKHLCHVFSVLTTDMAIEIILTLGQAFEVAYEEAIKLKSN